jgi:hypothetical protein
VMPRLRYRICSHQDFAMKADRTSGYLAVGLSSGIWSHVDSAPRSMCPRTGGRQLGGSD